MYIMLNKVCIPNSLWGFPWYPDCCQCIMKLTPSGYSIKDVHLSITLTSELYYVACLYKVGLVGALWYCKMQVAICMYCFTGPTPRSTTVLKQDKNLITNWYYEDLLNTVLLDMFFKTNMYRYRLLTAVDVGLVLCGLAGSSIRWVLRLGRLCHYKTMFIWV